MANRHSSPTDGEFCGGVQRIDPESWRPRWLPEEGEQTGGNERGSPNQIEVEPGLTKKRKAELTKHYPREQPCDGKISRRMDHAGEHSGQRAVGGRSHVMVTCH